MAHTWMSHGTHILPQDQTKAASACALRHVVMAYMVMAHK